MMDKLLKIFHHYGVFGQLRKLNEECYELIEAISDYVYETDAEESNECFNHMEEEFADVMVVLEQIKVHYELDNHRIMEIMEKKIDRTLERIEGDKNEERR